MTISLTKGDFLETNPSLRDGMENEVELNWTWNSGDNG